MLKDVLAKVEQIDSQRKELNKELFNLIKKEIISVLDKYPEFIGVRWTQSVPAFNDGDPCVFSLDEAYFVTSKDVSEVEGYDYDSCNTVEINEKLYLLYESESSWDYKLSKRIYDSLEAEEKENTLKTINKVLYTIKDLLETEFGSNAEVIITKDSIIVNGYSCGY